MTNYIEVVILINFFFDFIIISGVNFVLKKHAKFYRIIFGSLIGSLTIFTLFLKINSFQLFIFKIILSILINLVSFGEKNFLKTIFYFYILSIFLGGCLYLIKSNTNLYNNFIILIIISPIIIYLYVKEKFNYKANYSNKYIIDIYIKNKKYKLSGYLDTGNTLKDPYKKRDVIILNKDISFNNNKFIYVPYQTITDKGIIKCIKPDRVVINNKEFNCLIGKTNKSIFFKDCECILPNNFKEML